MSLPRQVQFAIGVLRHHGLSLAYASIVAQRILEPDATLTWDDAAWLRIVRHAMRSAERTNPRWANAN